MPERRGSGSSTLLSADMKKKSTLKKRFEKGTMPSSKTLNWIADQLERFNNMTGVNLNISSTTEGMSISSDDEFKIYAKITSGSNPYAWSEVTPDTGGTFVVTSGGRSGTTSDNAAYEINGKSVPANKIVVLRPGVQNEWLFEYLAKGGSGSSGVLLGCVCRTPPISIGMTVSTEGCSNGLFHACTITYQPTPAELAPLRLGTYCYLSEEFFTDAQTGDQFRYYLACFTSIIRISRVFPVSVYGSPFLDSVIYFWTAGLPGNTCTPFSMTNGSVFVGGDASCTVTLTG